MSPSQLLNEGKRRREGPKSVRPPSHEDTFTPPLNYKGEALDGFGIKRGNPPARTSGPSSVVTLGAVTPELPSVIGSEAFQREGNGAGRGTQEGFAAGGATSRHRKEHKPFHPHPNHSVPTGKSKNKIIFFRNKRASAAQTEARKPPGTRGGSFPQFPLFPSILGCFQAIWLAAPQQEAWRAGAAARRPSAAPHHAGSGFHLPDSPAKRIITL